MSDRPSELDLALDAIDDVFKEEVGNFTKDKGVWDGKPQAGIPDPDKFVEDGYNRARRARNSMIAMVKANAQIVLVCAALLFALAGSALADEPVCVVIHQEGVIRNATPEQAARGMIVDCELSDANALNWYLAHGGH